MPVPDIGLKLRVLGLRRPGDRDAAADPAAHRDG
jgi:hypothetical protein